MGEERKGEVRRGAWWGEDRRAERKGDGRGGEERGREHAARGWWDQGLAVSWYDAFGIVRLGSDLA